ncbi:MAG: transglycosylase domain-containing protein [Chloroflexi bacterium]|nr:transglycosylase domain-containing protein [Chloroflexota bacterium]MCI0580889.1 transglycosylase domain-containing protein [Chloroflexota bacterium]MCI0649737.1 transglycosylase domain-containing protein [Chloroflexota bacterium]MCI0725476.1 transglycosylase domain-containing protein [Chloroflexota bacterium]
MSRTTRVVRWRYRRHKTEGQGWRLIFRVASSLLLTGLLAVALLFVGSITAAAAVYDSLTSDLPDFTEIERLGQDTDTTFETTKIYAWGDDPDGDGRRDLVLIYEVIDPLGGDRQWLKLDQIPQTVVDATVAIEDKTFWTNQGFDVEGVGRAFYQYVWLGGEVQGGSSITQQLVKNNLIEEERRLVGEEVNFDDYRRKVEELLLAQRISQVYTKEQIMEWYLNTNFYGNLAYGIEAAARVYFDKTAAELTLAEAAMLAAIPQSPAFNPIDRPEEAKQRQELVLEAMYREGLIGQEALVAAKFSPIEVAPGIEERFDIIAPHFALYVRKQLEQQFGPAQVLRGGLRVYTSLDLEMQRQAECLARAEVARLSGEVGEGLTADERANCPALAFLPPLRQEEIGVERNVTNAAVVALDPRTGEIKAMVGSVDYWDETIDGSFNVAVDGLRQPGSSFKPFTYLTAFSQGYTAATMVLDVETDFGTPYNGVAYVPENYDSRFHGPMRLRLGLGNSYNIPAVQVMSWVGVDRVIRTAHSMGITSLDKGPNSYGLSLTLGGGEVRLIDMVYAFAVMDNMGVMIGQPAPESQQRLGFRTLDPVAILRVEDSDGRIMYEYNQPQRREILTPQLAFLINDILSDRSARCQAFGCPSILELPDGRPAAVKTGTTNDFRDAWTVGYTPQLVTGVWVGNSDNTPMNDVSGLAGAAPVWQAFMSWALQNEPVEGWPQPPGIVRRPVCELSGLLPTPYCPAVNEYFIEGTEPIIYDNLYQEFRINRETGRLATISTPPELIETKTYIIYPEQAADWVRENEIEQPPTEYDTITTPDGREGNAAITSPQPFAFVGDQIEIVGSAGGDNFAYYRLAFFRGLTPADLQSIVEQETAPKRNEALGVWDVSNLNGLYTLLLTVVRQDGSFDEVSLPVTVDNTPPTAEILFPLQDQSIFTDEEWVIVQAQAGDDLSIDRVEFYADGAGVPFAISTVPPFTEKWRIPGPGCHVFKVIAFDAAGNEAESAAVSVCLVER